MSRRPFFVLITCSVLVSVTLAPLFTVRAQTVPVAADDATAQTSDDEARSGALNHEIDQLQDQVKASKKRISELDTLIQGYKGKLKIQETAALTLQNQVALLENQIEEQQLQLEHTKTEIELANTEIKSLEDKIRLQQLLITSRQDAIGELVRRIRQTDQVSPLYVFLTKPSFSEYFARLDEVKRVQDEMVQATDALKKQKRDMEALKTDRETERTHLVERQHQLKKDELDLEEQRQAKVSLIAETQNKEGEFQRVVYELRQQQQSESESISGLQDRLKDRLNQSDQALAQGDTTLQWPITPAKGISARFHDKSYPFRNLFEHPGVDLPTDVGTPVRAAAGGYVAWTRTGKQYGNYIMIVHSGGIATVYAHLSRFGVQPDTYVDRGDIIGYSGGRPGDQGAGLSTGPHLHFEVRQNGIPTNPENFLPDLY